MTYPSVEKKFNTGFGKMEARLEKEIVVGTFFMNDLFI